MFFGLIDGPGKVMPKRKYGIVEFEPRIRLSQLLVLQYICQHGNKNTEQIAAEFDLSDAAVSRYGDVMQRMGYLTVTANTNMYGTGRFFNATDQGRALVRAVANQLASSI